MATRAELKARLTLDKSLFDRGIASATSGAHGLGRTFGAISGAGMGAFTRLLGVITAIGGIAGFGLATKHAFEVGDGLAEMSRQTGISAGSLSILQQAFSDAGIASDLLGISVNRMQRNLQKLAVKGDSSGNFAEQFQKILQMKPEDQFRAIGEMIRSIENPAKRAALAMEIFGRGGGQLLKLFMDPNIIEGATRAIGKQADIFQKHAALFDKVNDQLSHIKTKVQGFFVGVAASLGEKLSPILDKMEKLDLTGIGQKVGEGIGKAANAIVGLGSNLRLAAVAFEFALKAAVLGLGNVLLAVFGAAVSFFKDGMLAALEGIGAAIVSTLLKAFAKPVAFFQASIEAAAARVPGAMENEKSQAKTQVGTLTNMLAVVDKARDEAFAKSQAPNGSISDEERQRARDRFATNQEVHERLMAQRTAQEKIAAGNLPTVAERAQRILSEGGPRMGFGEEETAAEMGKRGGEKLSEAMDSAGRAVKEALNSKDVLGAGDAWNKAMGAVSEAVTQGGEVIEDVFGKTASGIDEEGEHVETSMSEKAKPMPGGVIDTGGGHFFSEKSGKGLFDKKSLLSPQEKSDFVKQLQAEGAISGVAVGHGALKTSRKEAEKNEIRKQLKADALAEKNATNLEKTRIATEKTADAWKDD